MAKTSPGTNSTGSRFTWASAAAVTMFVAPGPMEEVTIIARRRQAVGLQDAVALLRPAEDHPVVERERTSLVGTGGAIETEDRLDGMVGAPV